MYDLFANDFKKHLNVDKLFNKRNILFKIINKYFLYLAFKLVTNA